MMLIRFVIRVGLVLCASFSPTVGQVCAPPDPGENLTFTMAGEAKGKPETMYIDLASEATAGNAADAFQQCKQKADAAAQAIADLKIPNAEIVRRMYEFFSPTAGTPYAMVQPTAAPAGTKVSQVLEVKIKMANGSGADDLAGVISRVLDAANKAGVGFKQAPPWRAEVTGRIGITPVRYVLEDATDVEKNAVADSMARASQLKKALAGSGVRIGKLVGVRYSRAPTTEAFAYWPAAAPDVEGRDQKSASSSSPDEVVVRCTLTFTYDLEQAPESEKATEE